MNRSFSPNVLMEWENECTAVVFNQVFPKLYKVGNIANKGLRGEEQNELSQKIALSGD